MKFTTGPLNDAAREALSRHGEFGDGSGCFILKVKDRESINAAIDELRKAGVAVYAVEPHHMSLEEAFVNLIGAQPDQGVGGVRG